MSKKRNSPKAGLFLEYDWMVNAYRVRFGDSFIGYGSNNVRSFPSMKAAKAAIEKQGQKIARKVASRTWEIVNVTEAKKNARPLPLKRPLHKSTPKKPLTKPGAPRVSILKKNPKSGYVIRANLDHPSHSFPRSFAYYDGQNGFKGYPKQGKKYASKILALAAMQAIKFKLPSRIASLEAVKA